MQGGRGWLGGVEYIKNIILALASLPEESRQTFRLSLIVNEDFETELLEGVRLNLSHIQGCFILNYGFLCIDEVRGSSLPIYMITMVESLKIHCLNLE